MKFIVIGLGSMGKRRIRCLKALGFQNIVGFDLRDDRRKQVELEYGIRTISRIEKLSFIEFDAIIISTPPDNHSYYAKMAIENGKPVFIEASVLLDDVILIKQWNVNGTFVAPSCTLRFHPVISDLTEIVKSEKYGKVTNFTYHSGQYLPDWHPWEKIEDFYVSNRITGGAREIVPFELTWIVNCLGWPQEVKGVFAKTINLGVEIEDTYSFILKYDKCVGNILVDVVSRVAVRTLIMNFEFAQIKWNWDDSGYYIYIVNDNAWSFVDHKCISSAPGYNKNISEQMYIDEINNFINGISNPSCYPNSLEDDINILKILNKIETSDGGF